MTVENNTTIPQIGERSPETPNLMALLLRAVRRLSEHITVRVWAFFHVGVGLGSSKPRLHPANHATTPAHSLWAPIFAAIMLIALLIGLLTGSANPTANDDPPTTTTTTVVAESSNPIVNNGDNNHNTVINGDNSGNTVINNTQIVLSGLFEPGSAILGAQADERLTEVVHEIGANEGGTIEILPNSPPTSPEDFALNQARVDAIKAWLVDIGEIPASRISTSPTAPTPPSAGSAPSSATSPHSQAIELRLDDRIH